MNVTLPIKLTFEEANDLLDRAIAERGAKHVVNILPGQDSCAYFDPTTEKPSCGIGQILFYKGLRYQHLVSPLGGDNRNTGYNVSDLVEGGVLECDEETTSLLEQFQILQDDQVSWGNAVTTARSRLEFGALV
jgi:hypothetical protein